MDREHDNVLKCSAVEAKVAGLKVGTVDHQEFTNGHSVDARPRTLFEIVDGPSFDKVVCSNDIGTELGTGPETDTFRCRVIPVPEKTLPDKTFPLKFPPSTMKQRTVPVI